MSCLGASCVGDKLSYYINRGWVVGDKLLGTSCWGRVARGRDVSGRVDVMPIVSLDIIIHFRLIGWIKSVVLVEGYRKPLNITVRLNLNQVIVVRFDSHSRNGIFSFKAIRSNNQVFFWRLVLHFFIRRCGSELGSALRKFAWNGNFSALHFLALN